VARAARIICRPSRRATARSAGTGGACVGGVVQQQRVVSGGGRGCQGGCGQAGGVQPAAAERLQTVDVAYGSAGDGGLDTAGVGVPSGGEAAVGQQEQGCAAHG
jgi:hypothetical protein